MSAAPLRQTYAARPVRIAEPTPRRRDHLRAVTAPEPGRSLVPFAALCVSIVIAALVSVLLLNITMSRGAWEANAMRTEISKAEQARAALLTQLEGMSNPAGLAASAEALGMVPAPTLGFVSIGSQSVLHSGN